MSVVITGLPIGASSVPLKPASFSQAATDPPGTFLSVLRAVQTATGTDIHPDTKVSGVNHFGNAITAMLRASNQPKADTKATAASDGDATAAPDQPQASVGQQATRARGTPVDPWPINPLLTGSGSTESSAAPIIVSSDTVASGVAPNLSARATLPLRQKDINDPVRDAATPSARKSAGDDPAIANTAVTAQAPSILPLTVPPAPTALLPGNEGQERTTNTIFPGPQASRVPLGADATPPSVTASNTAPTPSPGAMAGTPPDRAPAADTPSVNVLLAAAAQNVRTPTPTAGAPAPQIPALQIHVQTVDQDASAANPPDQAVTGSQIKPVSAEGNESAGHPTDRNGTGRESRNTEPPAPMQNAAETSIAGDAVPVSQPPTVVPSTSQTASPVTASVLPTPAPDLVTSASVPASPVSQLAPALLTLGTSSDGTQQMSLRLQPAELGVVEVRIDRAPDGSAHVSVTADNPDTLQMLTGAQSDLHKALDAAGIAAGRTLNFALTPDMRPVGNLSDLPSRPVGEEHAAGEQSPGSGSGGQHGQGGGSSNSSSGGAFSGGSTGGAAGGSTADGGQAWTQGGRTFQAFSDQALANGDQGNDSFQTEGL